MIVLELFVNYKILQESRYIMKKGFTFLLLVTVLIVMVAGCGKSKASDSSIESENQVEEDNSTLSDDQEEDESNTPSDAQEEDDSSTPSDNQEEDDSNQDNESASTTDTTDDNEEASITTGDFLSINSYEDVISNFKEFGFVYNTKAAGEENVSWTFDYVYLGNESVDGVDTKHFKIKQVENGETDEYEAWFDDTWSALKFKNSEEEKTGIDAAFSGTSLTMMTQLYCNMLTLNTMVYKEDGTIDDEMYELKGKSNESIDLGNGSTDIELLVISSKFMDFDKLLGTSTFNDKKVYTVLETVSKDKEALDGLRITHLVLN